MGPVFLLTSRIISGEVPVERYCVNEEGIIARHISVIDAHLKEVDAYGRGNCLVLKMINVHFYLKAETKKYKRSYHML